MIPLNNGGAEDMNNLGFIKKFQVPQAAYSNIDQLFTLEEIAFVSQMEQEIFTEEDVRSMGVSDPKGFLERSYRRGIVSLVNEGEKTFRISDFYNRLDIFSISETETYRSFSKEDREALDEWYFEAYCSGLDPNPDLPPTEDEILPLDEVLDFIDKQERPVYLNYCDCRSLRGDCGLPTKTCITYKNGRNSFVHRGLSEQIDKEKAKEIVRKADQAGLMHTVNPNGICNCCGDCCYLFRGQEKRNSLGIWPKTSYIINFDRSKCIQCGKCVKRCSFEVFHKEGEIRADTEKCVGCGVCVQGCPGKALSLKGR
jgi:Pyruvate/2-oxoacid:ferredoxin oxidoreductase delta subunit